MKVIVNVASLACSNRGAITGGLHCDLDGTSFPDAQWNDLVVVVLGWWIRVLISTVQDEAIFRFMDGPFWIRLNPSLENLSSEVSLEAGDNNGSIQFGSAAREEIGVQLALAAEKVLGKCAEHQWKSDDVDVLLRDLGDLRLFLREIGVRGLQPKH